MQITDEIKKITQQIVAAVSPERIYLFGSFAYGTPKEDSDYDFYVVTSDKQCPPSIIGDIRGALMTDRVMKSIDILATDITNFEKRSKAPTLERKIAREGVILYERVRGRMV